MSTIARTSWGGGSGVKALVNVHDTSLENDGILSAYKNLQIAILVKAVVDYKFLKRHKHNFTGPESKDWRSAKLYLQQDSVYEDLGLNIKGKEVLELIDRMDRKGLKKRLNKYSIGV